MDRPARRAVPHDGRLALIRDADRPHVAGAYLRGRERLTRDGDGRGKDLLGVVLHVAGRGIVLRDLAVGHSANARVLPEHERGRAGRALVEREDHAHRRTVAPWFMAY